MNREAAALKLPKAAAPKLPATAAAPIPRQPSLYLAHGLPSYALEGYPERKGLKDAQVRNLTVDTHTHARTPARTYTRTHAHSAPAGICDNAKICPNKNKRAKSNFMHVWALGDRLPWSACHDIAHP